MPNAQGLLKQTVLAKQSALGAPATSGGKIKRRTNAIFTRNVDTYESNEIVSHQQSTGANAGIVKVGGKLDALLSPTTFSEQFASLLRKDAAATTAIATLSLTIAASAPNWTITRAAGDFLTGGIKAGDVIRITAGSVNAANLNKNCLVISLTATVLTVRPLNGVALVAEGPIASCTISVPGKKIWVPTTGHTNDFWSVEEWYPDVPASDLFTDCKIGKADITIPATGNATVSFDIPGLGRTRSASQQIASPSAETTTNILTAVNGVIFVNGLITPITGAQVTIDGNIAPGEAEVGTNNISDLIRGEIMVSGSFTAKFSATTLQAAFDAQTVIKIFLVITDGSGGAADFVTFVMSAVKLFGDAPDDGESKEVIRTYPFTAQINGAGGASLADHQTIISIQDSQAV
jgi:hypothetical protein